MGSICDEIALHRIDAVDLMACISQRFGKALRFIIARAVKFDIVSAVCKLFCILCHADNRLCETVGDNHRKNCGDQHEQNRDNDELAPDNADR